MKKILFTILSCFLFIGICNAEITTYDRNILDNYGVNKKWVIDEYNKFESRENLFNTLDSYISSHNYLQKSTIDKFFNLDILRLDTVDLYYEFKILQDLIKYSKTYQEQIKKDRHVMFAQPVISWAMVMILRYYMVS